MFLVQFPLISSDYAENWPEPVQRHIQYLIGDHLLLLAQTPSFSKLFIPRTNGLVCRRVLCVLCTKCTLHSNQTYSCDIPTHKTTSPQQRPFFHYIHSHRLAAEMWTTIKSKFWGEKLSYSFYLYRFRKYVPYGFPLINFCNPGVHYETPCIYRLITRMYSTRTSNQV
jgi:hypothetical protein